VEVNPKENTPKKAPLGHMNPALFIVLVLISTFITYQVFGGVLTVLIVGTKVEKFTENLVTTRIILSFAQFMFLLFPAVFLSMLQGNKFKDAFRVKKPDFTIFFLSIFGLVLIQPFLQAYLVIQNKILFSLPFGTDLIRQLKNIFDSLEQTTMNLVTAHNIPEFIFVVFVIAVTPAICEEFLFRGIVFKNFENVSLRRNAIFMTGLLFALFHFHPFNLIPLILLGFYLTFITYYSGSIFTAVACHFLNNFISAYSVFIFGKENFAEPDISGMQLLQFGMLGLVSLILFVFLLIYIVKLYNKKSQIVI
jgi:membrane protease YdiL (CAAX protease family)